VCDQWFKPADPNQPAACVFQNLEQSFFEGDAFRFRIVTFDPELELLPALQRAMDHGIDYPFGGQEARLAGVDWDETVRLAFIGEADGTGAQRLVLATPLNIRSVRRTVSDEELNLTHLVQACASRLNTLSAAYGNGESLDARPYLAEAAFAREIDASLRYVAPRRWSTTQGKSISLSGVVGWINLDNIHHAITDLLFTANVMHIGRHTGEGCGRVIAQPFSMPHAADDWDGKTEP
jgi:hypothetical protein